MKSKDIQTAINRIDAAFGTNHVFRIMSEEADWVREDPESFYIFLGRETKALKKYKSNGIKSGIVCTFRVVGLLNYEKVDSPGEKAAFTLDCITPFLTGGQLAATITPRPGSLVEDSPVSSTFYDAIGSYAVKVKVPDNAYGGAVPTIQEVYMATPSATEIFGINASQTWGLNGLPWKFYEDHRGDLLLTKRVFPPELGSATSTTLVRLRDLNTSSNKFPVIKIDGSLSDNNSGGIFASAFVCIG